MARFSRLQVYDAMMSSGMVPLFYHSDAATSLEIAKALSTGGSRLLEFTNRGDFAIEVFSSLVKQSQRECPDLIIGAGSVEDAATAALFIAHGANFIVSPTFNAEVARTCNRRKVAYSPGCSTLNEIATAEEHGAEIVKLFPGETSGGPDFVKAILAPRPWTSVMPTGGVSPERENLKAWFDAGVVCVGMGSKLLRKDHLANRNYEAITQATAETLSLIEAVRQK